MGPPFRRDRGRERHRPIGNPLRAVCICRTSMSFMSGISYRLPKDGHSEQRSTGIGHARLSRTEDHSRDAHRSWISHSESTRVSLSPLTQEHLLQEDWTSLEHFLEVHGTDLRRESLTQVFHKPADHTDQVSISLPASHSTHWNGVCADFRIFCRR